MNSRSRAWSKATAAPARGPGLTVGVAFVHVEPSKSHVSFRYCAPSNPPNRTARPREAWYASDAPPRPDGDAGGARSLHEAAPERWIAPGTRRIGPAIAAAPVSPPIRITSRRENRADVISLLGV